MQLEHQRMELIGSLSSITVSAGDLTGTATFNPTDSIYEGNETAVISISTVSGADAAESGLQSVTITITENESSLQLLLQHQLPYRRTLEHLNFNSYKFYCCR